MWITLFVAALVLGGGAFAAVAAAFDETSDATGASSAPQSASHPVYGWPTMNDPAHGLALAELPPYWEPIPSRALPATVSGLQHEARAPGGARGSGIAVFGSLAFVPTRGEDTLVFDISDPTNPVELSRARGTPGRDADVIAFPDGRLVLVLATDHGVVPVWDVTDPASPVLLTEISPPAGSHNLLVVPGTPILYNANSGGGGTVVDTTDVLGANGRTEIYDLSDPASPVLVDRWRNGFGCHDVTAFIDIHQQKYRAYCAGKEDTQIWDVTNPAAPSVIVSIPFPHGVRELPAARASFVHFSHLATVNHDASVLIVGDETGGGALMGCDVYADAEVRTLSGPLGNLWFYDVTDETNPVLRSWLSPSAEPGTGACTAHFGRVVEDRDVGVFGFYSAGTLLVDFSDVDHPVILDVEDPGGSVWDAWYYNGYAFTGDMSRGMDVYSFT